MKRLLLLLILGATIATGMVTSPRAQLELDFINAIAAGDIPKVRNFLNTGFPVNEPFTVIGFRGHTPLTVALMDKIPLYEVRNNTLQLKSMRDNSAHKYKIAESLIAQKADKAQLNALLAEAVMQKNPIKALWLVKNSSATADNNLLATIRSLAANSSVADKIIWTEIQNRFEKPATQLPVVVVTTEEQKELNLFDALQKRDLEAVKKAIAAGASPKEFKHIAWMKDLEERDRQPFAWVPLDQNGYKILDYLLSVGVDKKVLNYLLFLDVHEANKAGLEWVLARISKVEPSIIAHATQMEKDEKDIAKKARYTEIKKLLEAKK